MSSETVWEDAKACTTSTWRLGGSLVMRATRNGIIRPRLSEYLNRRNKEPEAEAQQSATGDQLPDPALSNHLVRFLFIHQTSALFAFAWLWLERVR